MRHYLPWVAYSLIAATLSVSSLNASEDAIPEDMQKIMHQEKYDHSFWGVYVKDLQTGEILYDLNSDKLFSPASTTKLFSVSALLNAFGDDYRFKTPVFASGKVSNGKLEGSLILVGQGDLTMGGRQPNADTIAFTKMDHIVANQVPGAILTKEDPLQGFNDLAKQVSKSGIREVTGDVVIDDSLFEIVEKRDMIITPIMINENLIDLVLNPTEVGEIANLKWRPQVPGYKIDNQVKTVSKDQKLDITITSDDSGQNIVLKGTIPQGQHNIVRTSSIKDPKAFARTAFIQALQQNGVKVASADKKPSEDLTLKSFKDPQQVALWTSPPLSQYAKLILKVSHNLGANLVPLLLASHDGKKTFNEGMQLIGNFVIGQVKISPNAFVLVDAAGGNENRFTPQAEIKLLEYSHNLPKEKFERFFDALPILGVDGSLEDFGKNTPAVGKVRAKPGTGVSINLATQRLFLITQALAGYVEGKNGHLYAYIVVTNNADMSTIEDVFAMFEDDSQLSNLIYEHTDSKK
ncbi:MAG: D-alanyl-D-alanine carboxypeptidase/D-alanyl-D-alanine-endopeptidase [Parachlamydiales bacterium]|jgi:D-alanyl-D-alanine carboxypeptidase/D-alanyl-D-alanine-endopeptidase (penicillin-binding protein 4)